MPKPKFRWVEMENHAKIQQYATLTTSQFKALVQLIIDFIELYPDDCNTTKRQWDDPHWRELAAKFIQEFGKHVWAKTRPGVKSPEREENDHDHKNYQNTKKGGKPQYKHAAHAAEDDQNDYPIEDMFVYPEDVVDIAFLVFNLMKIEAAKYFSVSKRAVRKATKLQEKRKREAFKPIHISQIGINEDLTDNDESVAEPTGKRVESLAKGYKRAKRATESGSPIPVQNSSTPAVTSRLFVGNSDEEGRSSEEVGVLGSRHAVVTTVKDSTKKGEGASKTARGKKYTDDCQVVEASDISELEYDIPSLTNNGRPTVDSTPCPSTPPDAKRTRSVVPKTQESPSSKDTKQASATSGVNYTYTHTPPKSPTPVGKLNNELLQKFQARKQWGPTEICIEDEGLEMSDSTPIKTPYFTPAAAISTNLPSGTPELNFAQSSSPIIPSSELEMTFSPSSPRAQSDTLELNLAQPSSPTIPSNKQEIDSPIVQSATPQVSSDPPSTSPKFTESTSVNFIFRVTIRSCALKPITVRLVYPGEHDNFAFFFDSVDQAASEKARDQLFEATKLSIEVFQADGELISTPSPTVNSADSIEKWWNDCLHGICCGVVGMANAGIEHEDVEWLDDEKVEMAVDFRFE